MESYEFSSAQRASGQSPSVTPTLPPRPDLALIPAEAPLESASAVAQPAAKPKKSIRFYAPEDVAVTPVVETPELQSIPTVNVVPCALFLRRNSKPVDCRFINDVEDPAEAYQQMMASRASLIQGILNNVRIKHDEMQSLIQRRAALAVPVADAPAEDDAPAPAEDDAPAPAEDDAPAAAEAPAPTEEDDFEMMEIYQVEETLEGYHQLPPPTAYGPGRGSPTIDWENDDF